MLRQGKQTGLYKNKNWTFHTIHSHATMGIRMTEGRMIHSEILEPIMKI